MYLKNIEVSGFKSFANRMNFVFEEGITGIVGPNGSGKSNIADAVRWVLGEQSASKLRSSKMEDVIFAGTEQRKAQGAAYVGITLDNSDHSLPIDYQEVTIARRVYRSGESEYLINGNVSRLKDVTRLFFDTGIGKEGYSIIGQGQIERILSDKPDDRRALFDEAAGIVKYKKNKQLTEKQLETEQVNLDRVSDILAGLEDRIEPLRIQSEKAKEYLNLRDELRVLEVNSFLFELNRLSDKAAHEKENLDITVAEKEKALEAYAKAREQYEQLEQQIEDISGEIESCRVYMNGKLLENERSEGEIRVLDARIAAAEKNIEEIKLSLSDAEGRRSERQESLEKYEEELNEILAEKKRQEGVFTEADTIRQELADEADALRKEISNAQTEMIDTMSLGGQLKEKIARYDAMLESIDLRKTELRSRYLAVRSEIEKESEEKKRLELQLSSVLEQKKSAGTKLSTCEKELSASTEKLSHEKAEIQRLNQSMIRLDSRLENLRNLAERYEGYGSSIRKVMEMKKSHPKIIGVVADIIEVKAGFETAIETALGGSIQNIVTKDSDEAKALINHLRTEKLGRATFLPISDVKSRGEVDPRVLRENGVLGLASELVNYDPAYKNVVEFLLGKNVVCDTMDSAVALSRKYNRSLRIVTKNGDLITPGGAMTGGAFKNQSNLLGRKREMEEIEKELRENGTKLRQAKEAEASLTMKRDSLKEEKERLSATLHQVSIEETSVTVGLDSLKEKITATAEETKRIEKEQEELEKQVKEIDLNKKELFDSEKQQDILVKDARERADRLTVQLSAKQEELSDQEKLVSRIRLDMNTTLQQEGYNRDNQKRIREEIASENRALGELDNRKKASEEEINSCREGMKAHKESIRKNTESVKKKEEVLASYTKEKEDIQKSHKSILDEREKISSEMNRLEKAEYTIGLTLERLEQEQENLATYMWEEYEITPGKAKELRDPNIPEGSLKKEITAKKQEMKKLGDVNVNAIEEYKEVSERYTFLKTQHDDIMEARDNLRSIIKELDETMKETFSEKFGEIQVMFNKVFKELFGGGKASLTLVDEENILETGVIINAQPPGKQLQNMMQLSGGEKSLSAIALLFAIQSLKPSPFCILDEIEAALDDSNVGRFAKYLKKLTKNTQFIVITHRKGTMEAADVLYGITMQEKGVSTLVSVNLIEDSLAE